MKNLCRVFFFVVLLALRADARILEVDAIALGRIGTGLSADGWSVANVSNYAESTANALRLNLKTSSVLSPVFDEVIVQVDLEVVSSSAADRRLAITPVVKNAARKDLASVCDYSPTRSKFIDQSITWPRGERIDSFYLSLEGGGSTGWGIRKMKLTLEPRPQPFVLHVN